MFKGPTDLCDVVSILVHCRDDDTYLVTQASTANVYWIPSVKCPKSESWSATARTLTKDVIMFDISNEKLIKLYRIWQPESEPFIHHVVFKVVITGDMKRRNKTAVLKDKSKLLWLKEAEIKNSPYVENLRSPELLDFLAISQEKTNTLHTTGTSHPEGSWTSILGYQPLSPLIEVLAKHVLITTQSNSLTANESLMSAASFNKPEQENLFKLFLVQCFPCMYMNINVFSNFIAKLDWPKDAVNDLFRTADVFQRRALSYRDLILMLAVVEPNSQHTGTVAELRCRYIFRFYDENNDTKMDYGEFKNMVRDVKQANQQPFDAATVNKDTDTIAKVVGIGPNKPLSLNEFLQSAGNQKFRGTSVLLRSNKSALTLITAADGAAKPAPPKQSTPSITPSMSVAKLPTPVSAAGRRRTLTVNKINYEVAVHTAKLKIGTIVDIDQVWNLQHAVCKTVDFKRTQTLRLLSLDSFSPKSLPNELLRGLHYFAQPITPFEASKKPGRRAKEAYTWGMVDSAGFANCLLSVCDKTCEILSQEPRLLEIESPVYVLGDLHGNFPDLFYFEKVLWQLGPALSPSTLLFLGDYVDRGPHSVEVVSYLFAYKVQAPHKMKLLRGNHEVREVQKMFTFLKECVAKFGEEMGTKVWNAVNNVFDNMPVAAVIDQRIFCCHGGIPPPWLCPVVSAINNIPCPLPLPDQQSALAWEIMWNDPVREAKMTPNLSMELLANSGFAVNTRRGTAHVFSIEALERFLQVNDFTHVIRAHEVQQSGFQVQQRGHLVTVFSSSHYCGSGNDAACVLTDHGKIRMFRVDTT